MMTNLRFIGSNKFKDRKFAVYLKIFNYHCLRIQQDVCLSSQLVSITRVSLKISINITYAPEPSSNPKTEAY